MNILVTGGAGYIGSHVCQALAQKGFTPIVIDNLTTGFEKNVLWGPFYKGSFDDKDLLQRIHKKENISAVFHMAGSVSVSESQTMPEKYLANNFVATQTFVQNLLNHKIQFFIFASSCAVYGDCQAPATEQQELLPMSVYGQTKKMAEDMLQKISTQQAMKSHILRFFNVAGAYDPIGDDRNPPLHLIPRAVRSSLNGQPLLKVYGDSFQTRDGTSVRDYVHVRDVVAACMMSLERLLQETKTVGYEIYNIGSGYGSSVQQVLNEVQRITGRKPPVELARARDGEPGSVIADLTKVQNELGWSPQHSSLENIIRTTWAHLKK